MNDPEEPKPASATADESVGLEPVTVGYPSPDFPGYPPFRFVLPPDWKAVPSPKLQAVVIGPDRLDGVRPNVVITTHRVLPVDDPTELLEELTDREMVRRGATLEHLAPPKESVSRSVRFKFAAAGSSERKAEPAASIDDSEAQDSPLELGLRDSVDDAVEIEQSFNLLYMPGDRISYVVAATGTYAHASSEGRDSVQAIIGSIQC